MSTAHANLQDAHSRDISSRVLPARQPLSAMDVVPEGDESVEVPSSSAPLPSAEEEDEAADTARAAALLTTPRKSTKRVRRRLNSDAPSASSTAAAEWTSSTASAQADNFTLAAASSLATAASSQRYRTPVKAESSSQRTLHSGADGSEPTAHASATMGMRLFTEQVAQVVQRQGITDYSKVADELVEVLASYDPTPPLTAPGSGSRRTAGGSGASGRSLDQRNIRRRVYDVLNVLEAVQIVSRDAKLVKWQDSCVRTRADVSAATDRIYRKRKQISDMLVAQVSLKNLIEHNKRTLLRREAAAQMNRDHAQQMALQAAQAVQQSVQQETPPQTTPQAGSLLAPPSPGPIPSSGASIASVSSQTSANLSTTAAAGIPVAPATPTRPLGLGSRSSVGSSRSVASPSRQPHHSMRYASLLSPALHSRHTSPFLSRFKKAVMAAPGGANLAKHGKSAAALEGTRPIEEATKSSAMESDLEIVAAPGVDAGSAAAANAESSLPPLQTLPLPFVLLYTASHHVLFVEQSDDRTEVAIHVHGGPYQLVEHGDVMRALGMHQVHTWDLPRFISNRELCKMYPQDAIINRQPYSQGQAPMSTSITNEAAAHVHSQLPSRPAHLPPHPPAQPSSSKHRMLQAALAQTQRQQQLQ